MSLRPPPPLPPAPVVPSVTDLDRVHDDCRRGHKSAVYEAINQTPALVQQAGNLGFTALHWAAQTGHVDIVELLLHSGADPNAVNANGDTALHLAAWKQHALVVAALLQEQFKARTDLKNNDGKLAEQLARSEEVVDAFAKPAANNIQLVEEDDDDDDSEDED